MKRVTLISILVLLLPAMVFAQARTTGEIAGQITDENGEPLAGATVTATSIDSGIEREVTTDANGNYYIGLLSVGNWSVVITAIGMQPRVTSFRVGLGEKIPLDAQMAPGEVIAEEITIYSSLTALETIGTQENIDYREDVELLPIDNRNINLVARLAGHVSDAVQTGGTNSIAGAPTYDTVVLLDGAEISDPFFGSGTTVYLEDMIEEVQVLTSGISARYGRFQGGVINAITKSGSNRYEATIRYEVDRESWNSKTPFGETQSDQKNETYQGTAGGYFYKDRAWFFGGYREIPASGENFTTAQTGDTFSRNDTEERWQVKLRGAPAASHLLDVSHLEFEGSTTNWFSANLRPAHLGAVRGSAGVPRETTTAAYQGVFGSNFFAEAQYAEKIQESFIGGDPNGGSAFIDWNTFNVFNNYWWDAADLDQRNNETGAAALTYSLSSASAGSHTIEGGVQFVDSLTGGENKQSPTQFNVIGFNQNFVAGNGPDGEPRYNITVETDCETGVCLTPATQRWSAIPLGGAQTLENTGVYVQDSISLGDWRFDVGVRYDEYQGSGSLAFHNLSFDKTVPRLGVSYNFTPVWQATAGWGRYTSRFNDNYAQGASRVGTAPSIDHNYTGPDSFGLTGDEVDALVFNDALWTDLAGFTGPGIFNEYLADDINAPFAEEATLSLRRALPRNSGTFVISYVNRQYEDLLTSFVGGVCDFSGIFSFSHETESCPGANTTDILAADGVTVEGQVDTTVWANDPRNQREYEGISLQANYRPGQRWNIGGSYTFSETTGNYEGEGENTPAGGGDLGAFERSRPLAGVAPFGFLDEDLRHRIRAFGSYRWDIGRAGALALSGIWSRQSGNRYSLAATVPFANDPAYLTDTANSYSHFFDGRGNNRFRNFERVDLAVRYDVPIFNKLGLWVKTTVINAFNNDELLSFETDGSAALTNGILQFQPNGNCGINDAPSTSCTGFGQITDEDQYQRPREYFFTVGLRFN